MNCENHPERHGAFSYNGHTVCTECFGDMRPSSGKILIHTPGPKLGSSPLVVAAKASKTDVAAEKRLLGRALSTALQLNGLYKRMGDTRKEGITAKAFVELLKLGNSQSECRQIEGINPISLAASLVSCKQ